MNTLKNIKYEMSNDICEIDIERLDKALLTMPAEKYIELYNKMQLHIEHKIIEIEED